MDNIVFVNFECNETIKLVPKKIWQYGYGQILRIQGLNLPSAVEIHFSLQKSGGVAERRIGVTRDGVTDVVIPDFILKGGGIERDYYAYAFIYLSSEEYGQTEHRIELNIISRPEPEGSTGSDETSFGAIMDAVNKIAEQNGQGVSDEKIAEAVNTYMEENPVEGANVTAEKISEVLGYTPAKETDVSQLSDTVNDQREDIANKELSGTAEAKVAEHNVSEESHSDIRLLIDNLSELVTSLLDSDDETLNQTSEIVAYVKSNKSLIDSITTSKVNVSDIIDNLTTNVSNKPLSAKQGVVLKGLIDTLQAELNKITIPTALPNPHKLIFQGAVTAEYDGSGAVTVTIPSGNGGSVTERIEKLSTDTEVELQPNKLYIFPEMNTLTYTLAEISDNSVLNEYHFVFQSGATATEVVHPESVNIGSFAVEANKIYEISIMEGLLTSQSWAVS